MTSIGTPSIPLLEKRLVGLGLVAYLLLALLVSLSSSGTYDAGDSVMHFQIARYAFLHPENFLSHWGKPFFTLVASPFAQLGFGGMKLMQCLLAAGTGWMLWRSAWRLALQPRWLAPVLAWVAPEFILSQLSGLTEPLFAFMLLLGVLLCLEERPVWAALALSFLPFVRTEGFLLLPVFGLYFLLRRDWRSLPLLAAGTVLYMLIGGIAKGNFLWIWTENPYAVKTQNYGIGGLGHFPLQYLFVVGIPAYALTALGLLALPLHVWRRTPHRLALLLLVAGPFFTYLGAHMFFWATGTGHSMGLIRVLIGIVPLGALLSVAGLQLFLGFLPWAKARLAIPVVVALLGVAFPFTSNPAAIRAADLELAVDQVMLQDVAAWMQAQGLADRKIYSAHPATAFYLGVDPFDPQRYRSLNRLRDETPPKGTIILLDSWFGRVEAGYSPEAFTSQPANYLFLKEWKGEADGVPVVMTLFERL